MKRTLKSNNPSAAKRKTPEQEAATPKAAAQAWRDRLQKTKSGSAQANAQGNKAEASERNRSQYIAPSGTQRKTRKGLRPG